MKAYPTKPRFLGKLAWFYEQRMGIDVLIQPNQNTNPVQARLSWSKLEAAVDRHRAIKKSKAKKTRTHDRP